MADQDRRDCPPASSRSSRSSRACSPAARSSPASSRPGRPGSPGRSARRGSAGSSSGPRRSCSWSLLAGSGDRPDGRGPDTTCPAVGRPRPVVRRLPGARAPRRRPGAPGRLDRPRLRGDPRPVDPDARAQPDAGRRDRDRGRQGRARAAHERGRDRERRRLLVQRREPVHRQPAAAAGRHDRDLGGAQRDPSGDRRTAGTSRAGSPTSSLYIPGSAVSRVERREALGSWSASPLRSSCSAAASWFAVVRAEGRRRRAGAGPLRGAILRPDGQRPRSPSTTPPSACSRASGGPRRAGCPRSPRSRRRPGSGSPSRSRAWALIVVFSEPWGRLWGTGQDARCYWQATLANPYLHSDWNDPIAYVYSPAFLQLVSPLTALPWQAFMAAWTAILLAAVRFLTGPRLLAAGLLFPFTAMEVAGGNVSLLLAAAIVLGFRWPAAWSIVLLTKITPGIGLLWFAVRREWRSLAIALGATAAIAAVSFVTPARPVADLGRRRRSGTSPPARAGPGRRSPCRSGSACRSPSRSSSGAPGRTAAGRCRSRRCWRCPRCGTAGCRCCWR